MSKELTGAGAPRTPTNEPWNGRAARVLRRECRLSGPTLARALRWWKVCREKGKGRGIGDAELEAAVVGLKRCMRVRMPWEPYKLFCRKNTALFQEAMSAGFKVQARGPQRIGSVLKALARDA